jgi:hypothetical protein
MTRIVSRTEEATLSSTGLASPQAEHMTQGVCRIDSADGPIDYLPGIGHLG